MGGPRFSRSDFEKSKITFGITRDTDVTEAAERQVRVTGKLRPSVDPSQDVVRRSLMRFDPTADGHWIVTVGVPMPVESEVDTTGSMGNNVDIAMRNLPDTYELAAEMLPGYDPQLALGIFDDEVDQFILQRPQFEMTAEKIVGYLKDMAPGRDGGDAAEDPQYGLFAAAYLSDAYINRIGLKGYHFCISDATAHDRFSMENLVRVFGADVLERANENIKQHYSENRRITPAMIPGLTIKAVVQDLLKLSHAFFIQVKSYGIVRSFWENIYGRDRVITIKTTDYLPQVQAAIIGLTEGTLTLSDTGSWLRQHDVPDYTIQDLVDQLARIPLGAQANLRAKLEHPLPKAGDIFAQKTDLWPMSKDQSDMTQDGGIDWL